MHNTKDKGIDLPNYWLIWRIKLISYRLIIHITLKAFSDCYRLSCKCLSMQSKHLQCCNSPKPLSLKKWSTLLWPRQIYCWEGFFFWPKWCQRFYINLSTFNHFFSYTCSVVSVLPYMADGTMMEAAITLTSHFLLLISETRADKAYSF